MQTEAAKNLAEIYCQSIDSLELEEASLVSKIEYLDDKEYFDIKIIYSFEYSGIEEYEEMSLKADAEVAQLKSKNKVLRDNLYAELKQTQDAILFLENQDEQNTHH
jgi:hypothetical protein